MNLLSSRFKIGTRYLATLHPERGITNNFVFAIVLAGANVLTFRISQTFCGKKAEGAGLPPGGRCSKLRSGSNPLVLIPHDQLRSKIKAEGAGFEPAVQLPVRQFSKLVVSATHPSLRIVFQYFKKTI